jgi:glycosyltransferase involved in cell wall biosynthesis
MKILVMTHVETIGGRRRLLIKTLKKAGHEVRVVAWNSTGNEYNYDFPVTYIRNLSRVGFKQSLKQGFLITLARIVGGLYPRTLKELLSSSWDLLHCCHLSMLPAAILAKMLKGGKLIFDSYEFHGLNLSAKMNRPRIASLMAGIIETVEKLLLPWVDGVLTVPSVGDREKKKFAKLCKNLEVLMNVPSSAEIIDRKVFSPPPTAVYFGHIKKEKGLYEMLEATSLVAASIPEFKLILIGPIFEKPEKVENKIDSLGIRDNVVLYRRWVPIDEVREVLASAWVGLSPYQPSLLYSYITVGNSRKTFEYMMHGIPLVAASFGEIAKAVAEESAGILVDATKPEALAGGIKELIENKELREQMSRNGLAAVRNKYNWEKESLKLLRVYRAVAGPQESDNPDIHKETVLEAAISRMA